MAQCSCVCSGRVMRLAVHAPPRVAPLLRGGGGGDARPRRTRQVAAHNHNHHHRARRAAVQAASAAARSGAATTAAAAATAATTAAAEAVVDTAALDPEQQPQHPQQPLAAGPPPVRSASGRALDDPARIHASGTAEVRVPGGGGGGGGGAASLEAYMRLPVEQYCVLDPDQVACFGAGLFQLTLPRVELLGASLAPVIDVAVDPRPDSVVLSAVRCRLRGGGPLAALDDRSSLRFSTVVTWRPRQQQQQQQPQQQKQKQHKHGGGSGSGSAASSSGAVLTATTRVEVYCEVVPPFQLMPRGALEASCNAVLRQLVGTLLPVFLRNLAQDYERWANDPTYRAERAARSRRASAPLPLVRQQQAPLV